MKIPNMDGEFGFKALFKTYEYGWILSNNYYLTPEEAAREFGDTEYKWPVEVLDNGSVYVPDRSELE